MLNFEGVYHTFHLLAAGIAAAVAIKQGSLWAEWGGWDMQGISFGSETKQMKSGHKSWSGNKESSEQEEVLCQPQAVRRPQFEKHCFLSYAGNTKVDW